MRKLLSIIVLLSIILFSFGGYVMAESRPSNNAKDKEISQLLTVLRNEQIIEQEPERVVNAIRRLGKLKAVAAIDDLVRLLTFRRTFEWEDESVDAVQEFRVITILERYPAAGALFEIGKPSLPALVKVIENNESGSLLSENAVCAVEGIFRDRPLEGAIYLENTATKSSSTEAAQRLQGVASKLLTKAGL